MKNIKHLCIKTNLILGMACYISISCNKTFDEPPVFQEPNVTVNCTIKELKSLHTKGAVEKIVDDKIISGIVVADDKTGNFYKSLVIQDTTGGITLRLDGTGLYTTYPVGRRLYIKLKDLYLGDYNGLVQLGGGIDENDPNNTELAALASGLFDQYILKGSLNNPIIPKIVSFSSLTTQMLDTLQSTLIQLENFEFKVADTAKNYAVTNQTTNFTIVNCSGNSIILRNSGYASFAEVNLPNNNGAITAIYSIYGSTKQLLIRDTMDVQFTGVRCASTGPQVLLDQNFQSGTTNADINIPGWQNIAEAGNKKYENKFFGSTKYAQITAFQSNQNEVVSWLITPPINVDNTANEVLTFDTKAGYHNGATLKVLISTDYNESITPWAATWTELPAVLSQGQLTGYPSNFTNSGSINLNNYAGTIHLAFKYEGGDQSETSNDRTTTWQIDNIKIVGY